MIEIYAFIAAFAAQTLVLSVVHPALLIKYSRTKATELPPERFPHLYPGAFRRLSTERSLTLYRALNTGIAVLGVLLIVWLFGYMRRPDWEWSRTIVISVMYFMMQMLPLGLVTLLGLRYIKVLRSLPSEGKRKAVLRRRGLFDFISPFVVLIALATYVLFVAFMIYAVHFREGPFSPLAGYVILGVVTLSYVASGIHLYKILYGRKLNPLETHADRAHSIGLGVKTSIYTGIATDLYLPLFFTLMLAGLSAWMPFAQSLFFFVFALIICMPFISLLRRAEGEGFSSSTVA